MPIKSNIVKGWITSIIGTFLMLGGLVLWLTGAIKIWPDGCIAIGLGCTLLLAPRTIESKLSQLIRSWTGNISPTNQPIEPNPEEEEKNG